MPEYGKTLGSGIVKATAGRLTTAAGTPELGQLVSLFTDVFSSIKSRLDVIDITPVTKKLTDNLELLNRSIEEITRKTPSASINEYLQRQRQLLITQNILRERMNLPWVREEAITTAERETEATGGFIKGLLMGGGGGGILGGILMGLTGFWITSILKALEIRKLEAEFAGLAGVSLATAKNLGLVSNQSALLGYSLADVYKHAILLQRSFGTVSQSLIVNFQTITRAYGLSMEEVVKIFQPYRDIGRRIVMGAEGSPVIRIDDDSIQKLSTQFINVAAAMYGNSGVLMERMLSVVGNIYRSFLDFSGVNLRHSAQTIFALEKMLLQSEQLTEEQAGRIIEGIGQTIAQPTTPGMELLFLRMLGWQGDLVGYVRLRAAMERPFEPIGETDRRIPAIEILRNISNNLNTIPQGLSTIFLRNLFNLTFSQAEQLDAILRKQGVNAAVNTLKELKEKQERMEKIQAKAWENMSELSVQQLFTLLKNMVFQIGLNSDFLSIIAKWAVKNLDKDAATQFENTLRKLEQTQENIREMEIIGAKEQERIAINQRLDLLNLGISTMKPSTPAEKMAIEAFKKEYSIEKQQNILLFLDFLKRYLATQQGLNWGPIANVYIVTKDNRYILVAQTKNGPAFTYELEVGTGNK